MKRLTNTPHEKIFRLSLSNVEVAIDFLSIYLPKQMMQTCGASRKTQSTFA